MGSPLVFGIPKLTVDSLTRLGFFFGSTPYIPGTEFRDMLGKYLWLWKYNKNIINFPCKDN